MNSLRSFLIFTLIGLAWCQNCDFDTPRADDSDIPRCGWSNEYEDDFDWSTSRFPTLTPFTGPTGDHTTGSGYFMYTEANGNNPGEKARLYFPTKLQANTDPNTVTVITFWYSMWDALSAGDRLSNMGTLNLYLEYGQGTVPVPTGEPVWSRSGTQTDRDGWKEARIMVKAPSPFRIVFEGVIGEGDRSDIGIDDVKVIQTEMSMECDFETSPLGDLCMFQQDELTDDFDWTRGSGETPTLDTGPMKDHTYENDSGHYLYIETTRPAAPDRAVARLTSMPLFTLQPCEFSFYVHAFGDDIGQLTVIVESEGSRSEIVVVNGTGDSDTWVNKMIPIADHVGSYTITFEGYYGGGPLGDIAIDDISLDSNCNVVDPCESNPCLNEGACFSNEDGYECECTAGWGGDNCGEDLVECTPESCPEGFVCEDLISEIICVCPKGFEGENCEIEIPPLEPINTRTQGVNPDMIPVIIGSTVGSFILIVTAAWFTATCIRQDGFRKKQEEIEMDVEKDVDEIVTDGDRPPTDGNAFVNSAYDPDDDRASLKLDKEKANDVGETSKTEIAPTYEEAAEMPSNKKESREDSKGGEVTMVTADEAKGVEQGEVAKEEVTNVKSEKAGKSEEGVEAKTEGDAESEKAKKVEKGEDDVEKGKVNEEKSEKEDEGVSHEEKGEGGEKGATKEVEKTMPKDESAVYDDVASPEATVDATTHDDGVPTTTL